MFQMRFGECSNANSVVLLVSILNDIRYWGITMHGKSCLDDIGLSLRATQVRVSWLSESTSILKLGLRDLYW